MNSKTIHPTRTPRSPHTFFCWEHGFLYLRIMKVDMPSGRETLIAKVPRWLPGAPAVAGNLCQWLDVDHEVTNAINANRPSE